MDFKNKDELHEYSKKIVGTKVGDLDKKNLLNKSGNKGLIGQLVETEFFNKPLDSSKEADLKLLDGTNVELKVTPIKQNKNKSFSSKERLVLGIIDYMTVWEQPFETSDLLFKIRDMLLIFYWHDENVSKDEFEFVNTAMFDIIENSEDYPIIKQDYEKIINKIKNGKAHEISESDTLYLSACTKGANAKSSMRQQPFSSEPARQRAFAFKSSYMTEFYNNLKSNNPNTTEVAEPRVHIINTLMKYSHMDIFELGEKYQIKRNAKQYNQLVIKKILHEENLIQFLDKANIIIKTVPLKQLKKDGTFRAKESMKIMNLKPNSFDCEWEESSVYHYLDEHIFLFAYIHDNNIVDVQIHNFSYEERNGLKKVWLNAKKSFKDGINSEPMPKASNSEFGHLRPCGTNKNDTMITPYGDIITKQAFWINSGYISYLFNNKNGN